jgi:acyl dehydratase
MNEQQLQKLLGSRLGPYNSFNPVNRAQIWQWCSVMGDNNPLYLNDDYRKNAGFASVVAPPAMMQMWTMRDFNDHYAPGSTNAAPYQIFDEMTALGFGGNVAVSYDLSFHRYLLEGERVHHYTTVVNISEKKTTALGEGFFVTEHVEYLTEDESCFAEALITYFQYRPAKQTASSRGESDIAAQSATTDAEACINQWQPDFKDIDVAALKPGESLPELVIPITHRLIVAGAMATQDFTPVHHNLPAAQAASMPDIFMNILTTNGLCARYLSDWAGPASRLKRMQFKLMAPNTPGDTMTLRGKVKGIETKGDKGDTAELDVEFSGTNRRGSHVQGRARISVPATKKS